MNYELELKKEKEKAVITQKLVAQALINLQESLKAMGAENLQKLQDLQEQKDSDYHDVLLFIEQLHQKNIAFNFKDKLARVEELKHLNLEPFFARIDLLNPENSEINNVYLGKFGFSLDKPIIIDWRAKISSVFYRYRYPQKNVEYQTEEGKQVRDLTLKRTFEFDDSVLIKLYNNDLQLEENEVITEKIGHRTGGVLEDIVATIQENQLDIIESDPRQVCVVQGCVGSGKSTVAIHKLSHIFFNYPNFIRAERSILIAKSQVLVGYLATLFPKLGIFDINYGTLKDIIIKLFFAHELNIPLNLGDNGKLDAFTNDKVKNLKSIVSEVKENVIKTLEELSNKDEYASIFSYVYDNGLAITENIQSAIADLLEEFSIQKEFLAQGLDPRRELVARENIKNLRSLMAELRKLNNSVKNQAFSQALKQAEITYEKGLNYEEALVYIYLYSELIGLTQFKKFEYCVIDEGQDFSLLEYLVLGKVVLNGRFCILGDLNQSYQAEGLSKWEEISEVIEETRSSVKFELTTNYRSTKSIIDYANSLLKPYTKLYLPKSINRAGPEVTEHQVNQTSEAFESVVSELTKDLENLNKSVGIILFDSSKLAEFESYLHSKLERSLLPQDKFIVLKEENRTIFSPKAVYLTSFENCKGLEFSKVYVIGMPKNSDNFLTSKMQYVAATRAMNELIVYYINND